jgi:hypothetical protein
MGSFFLAGMEVFGCKLLMDNPSRENGKWVRLVIFDLHRIVNRG